MPLEMKFLKGLALFIIGFLLFLSLSVFGMVFTLNQTVLNPDFITAEINSLDASALAEEIIDEQTPGGFQMALANTIAELEPLVKEGVNAAIYALYDYLLGKRQNPELALTLRDTLVTREFFIAVVDKVDISSLAQELLDEQLAGSVPPEIDSYLSASLDETIAELKPWLKEQINVAADPILDYLVGERRTFNVVIPVDTVWQTLRDNLKEAFLNSPPPELAGLTPAEIEQEFDDLYQEFAGGLPATLEIDESLLGADLPANIAEGLAQAEEGLILARQYISYLQTGFILLICFTLLLILLFALVSHEVRGSTRGLGINFLICGIFSFAGFLLAMKAADTALAQASMPVYLQTWTPQLLAHALSPLQIYSICLMVIGVVLLIVSFVYRPHRTF